MTGDVKILSSPASQLFTRLRVAHKVIGPERETATLLSNLTCERERAWWRFRPTSIPPLAVRLLAISTNRSGDFVFEILLAALTTL